MPIIPVMQNSCLHIVNNTSLHINLMEESVSNSINNLHSGISDDFNERTALCKHNIQMNTKIGESGIKEQNNNQQNTITALLINNSHYHRHHHPHYHYQQQQQQHYHQQNRHQHINQINNNSNGGTSDPLTGQKMYPNKEINNTSFSSGLIQDDMIDQCGLTQAGLEEYNSNSYYDQPVYHHQKQSSYAQSEGYHSYVSSSDSSSATPFLDRLRQESDLLSRQSNHWSQNDLSSTANNISNGTANTSLDNNSSESASSTETLKWLGSMSDVSVASHTTNTSAISGSVTSSSKLIVHSSRVRTPKRHNSESVLYMADDQMSVTNEVNGIQDNVSECIQQYSNHQHHHHHHHNLHQHQQQQQNQLKQQPYHTQTDSIKSGELKNIPSVSTSNICSSLSTIAPISTSITIMMTTTSSVSSYRNNHRLFPVSTYTEPVNGTVDYQTYQKQYPQTTIAQPQQKSPQSITSIKYSSPHPPNWQSVADRINDIEQQHQQQNNSKHHYLHQNQKYSYIDPSKTHRISNPALKAFQKNAVQSYFERQQLNAKEINKTQTSIRPQSLPLVNTIKDIPIPPLRTSLPANYNSPNSHKNLSRAQENISQGCCEGNILKPPSPPPRSRSLMPPIRRSSSASDYAEFRDHFLHTNDNQGAIKQQQQLLSISNPEKASFNDCGMPPPPPPRGLPSMPPVRRTSSASEYTHLKDQNIQSKQNLSKDLLGPIIMGPIISVDDWVPERPPKNPHLRIPSPDLPPPPPLQPNETDINLLNQDEPLPPPPPEILQNIPQNSIEESDNKPPSPNRRNSFAGSSSRKTIYRAQTFENLTQPAIPRKLSPLEIIQTRPASSLATSHKAHKVILNGKLECPNGYNSGEEPLPRANDIRISIRKRLHAQTSDSKLVKMNGVGVKSPPPPLKPRMPIVGHDTKSPALAINTKIRCNSKATYLPRQSREKPNVTDPDHGSYKLTLTSNEDSINHNNSSYHHNILSTKCTNLPDVLPVGAKIQTSPICSTSSQHYNNTNNSNFSQPHTAPVMIQSNYPMKSMFHFHSPTNSSSPNNISPSSPNPPSSYGIIAINRSSSSPASSNNSLSPKYMSQSTIDLKKTHIIDTNQNSLEKILSPAHSENNISNHLKPQTSYRCNNENSRKLSLEEYHPNGEHLVRAELVNTTISSSPPKTDDTRVFHKKESLRENIEKITQLQTKLMSGHQNDSNLVERRLNNQKLKTIEIRPRSIDSDCSKTESKSTTPSDSPNRIFHDKFDTNRLTQMDNEIDGLKMMQRTEIILRLNAPTVETASQTDETLETELSRSKGNDFKDDLNNKTEEKINLMLKPRKEHPEEIDCDNFTKYFIKFLSPTDKLHNILAPKVYKSTLDYISGFCNPNIGFRPTKRDVGTSTSNHKNVGCDLIINPIKDEVLTSNTNFYINNESKEILMSAKYNNDVTIINGGKICDLTRKKEELINRLTKKQLVLGNEQKMINEESTKNEQIGNDLINKIVQKVRTNDATKFRAYIDDVGHITLLLLSLSGRLAVLDNSLYNMPEDHTDKKILQTKRDRLLEQLDEAKRLKEDIDRRGNIVSKILGKHLNDEEYEDYEYFINMKVKLFVDLREITDKIRLGEEQLNALKDTLIQNEC